MTEMRQNPPAADAPDTSISARLREATSVEHRDAESRSFIVQLMTGHLDLERYADYLGQFRAVYAALESREPRADEPAILGDARLHRGDAIEADIRALGGHGSVELLPATQSYVDHLTAIARSGDPVRYLAHHYTRYLGDLSGGQIISTMLARHYSATPEQLSFYRFEGIDKLVPYKRDYRAAVDAWDLDEDAFAVLVEESRLAYSFNAAMFDELGADLAEAPAA